MHPLISQLIELDLPPGDWALFGSGPLLMRGWISEVSDLDVIARGKALTVAETTGEPITYANGRTIWAFGDVTVGGYWYYGDVSIDDLIDTAEVIGGIPCVRLDHVIAYKRIADRPKDRAHLAVIDEMAP